MEIGSCGLVRYKIIEEKHFTREPRREWYFFTRDGAETYLNGELKGRGELREIIPLDAHKLARSMELLPNAE